MIHVKRQSACSRIMLLDFRSQPMENKMVVWVVLVIAGVVTIIWTVAYNQGGYSAAPWLTRESGSRPPDEPCLSQEMRRRLAASLTRLKREMESHLGGGVGGGGNDTGWRLWWEMGTVAAILDPRLARDALRPPSLVCPEHHDGTRYVVTPCKSSPRLSHVVSVVLPARAWPHDRLARVLRGLASAHHHLQVVVILSSDDADATSPPDVADGDVVLRYDEGVSDGRALNAAVGNVTTPFVFVGEALADFSWEQSPLQRLLRVLDRLGGVGGVASGAYRDPDGQWRHGCLQRSLTNYHATFLRGYIYSAQACMYCDDALGPLVIRTPLVQRLPFRDSLSGPAVYRDWHTRAAQAGYLTVVCPDAMFFVEQEALMEASDWKSYASLWGVQSVRSYDEEEYRFSCSDVRLDCSNLRKRVAWYLVPPCCREAIMRGVAILDDFAREKGLTYELQHGSLLGAVKLGTYLPWDFDQDIRYDCRQRRAWETLKDYLKERKSGCHLRPSGDKHLLVLQCKTFFVDMACRSPLSHHALPPAHRNTTTWVLYGGRRVGVAANPGGVAREQSGPEHLRHAQHWRIPDRPDPGAWRPCRTPSSHTCLDQHPADGSLAFSTPPQCLP
ncbi:uncharacterized protein [Panulirus ornatus]|uniref:uncharacterized protein isoform X2 n=1 Tax=Panulirus ornatus TaxID=150431 RepID=UPI003A88F595